MRKGIGGGEGSDALNQIKTMTSMRDGWIDSPPTGH